jgi:hypothetical protein
VVFWCKIQSTLSVKKFNISLEFLSSLSFTQNTIKGSIFPDNNENHTSTANIKTAAI